MRSKLAYFAGIGAASAAGWFAHSVWADPPDEPAVARRQVASGDLTARLDQLERQQRRQLDVVVAMQRDLQGLIEVTYRAAGGEAPRPSARPDATDPSAGEDAPPIPTGEPIPTIEQSRAASEAETIVQRATVSGRWTDADSHRLDEQLRLMEPKDAEELRRSVIAALNRGELEIAFSGRPAF